MIRVAVVEDEDFYVDQLTSYLQKYQDEYQEEINISVYRNGDGIVNGYRAQFDIILMDIQMSFMDGMTAAAEIRKMDTKVVIMFITNMTQYAIRGYEVDALDYILKPVSYFAFSQKLSRAITRLRKRDRKYITISAKGGMVRQDIDDLYYIESQGHSLIYVTRGGSIISSGTMKDAEAQLLPYGFSRGNKCYLINLRHVDRIENQCAVVKGTALQLSRPRKNAFVQDLTEFWGDL